MFLRKYWVPLTVFLVLIVGVSVYYLQTRPPKEPIVIYKTTPVEIEKPTTEVEKSDASQGGHIHEDGTWHEGTHETHEVPNGAIPAQPPVAASRDYKPTVVQIPEGITNPDVLAAWKRVDYIANNLWEWGGVANAETPELIAKLMPPPDGFSGPTGHSDIEETINLLGSLDTNDPRSAEVMAVYLCEGLVGGNDPIDMLTEMGVPAVPYLIPYMLDMEAMPALRRYPIEVLGRIGERHRAELDGIVEHIIIPRLETILSQEKPDYDEGKGAREALSRLK
ncbi:MAG: hypothetical protein OXH00_18770 [Candidatus Poribacteria bacterium]|nr:hypothetical protein [Candidatus Poribacteria bacterium]